MCLDTYGCLKWWKCFLLKNSKFGDTNTMFCIKFFVERFGVVAKIQCDDIQITSRIKRLIS